MFQLMKQATGAAICLAVLGFSTDGAEARMCDSRDNVTKLLENRYKEAPIALGIVSDRGVMEVYVSEASGTWSVVVTTPQGKACIIAAGQNYEAVQAKLLDPAA